MEILIKFCKCGESLEFICRVFRMLNFLKMAKFGFNMAKKSIGRRKFRAALTILGIIIGVSTIVSLMSVGEGMQYEVETTLNDMLGAGITIRSEGMEATIPEYIQEYVLQVPGVKDCVPVIMTMREIGDRQTMIIGIDPDEAASLYQITLSEGRMPSSGEDNLLVIGSMTANRLGLHLNDTITLGSSTGGVGESFIIVGIMRSIGSGSMNIGAYISLRAAQHLMGKDGYASSLLVVLDDPDQAEFIENVLKNMFPEANIMRQEALLEQISQIMDIVNGVLLALGTVSLAVGAIGVMNTITMSVYERTREIGMMKAVGGERSHILFLFISESAVIGMIGGVLGIIFGISFVNAINYLVLMLGSQFIIPIVVTPQIILTAFLISLVIAILAGFYPSWKAANIRPVEALRYE